MASNKSKKYKQTHMVMSKIEHEQHHRQSKIVTVNDLLTRDDINTVVKEILENRADMSSLIVIYEDKDGAINSNHSTMDLSKATYLLEQVKHWLLSGDTE